MTNNGIAPAIIRILAIDDNEDFRALLKELLTPMGFEITLASNPVKALELYQRDMNNFDLVLLDYFMPQMDGAKTFEWLRKLNPKVKVVVISGSDELRLRQIQAQTPIAGYIRKPFRTVEAVALLRRIMAQPARD